MTCANNMDSRFTGFVWMALLQVLRFSFCFYKDWQLLVKKYVWTMYSYSIGWDIFIEECDYYGFCSIGHMAERKLGMSSKYSLNCGIEKEHIIFIVFLFENVGFFFDELWTELFRASSGFLKLRKFRNGMQRFVWEIMKKSWVLNDFLNNIVLQRHKLYTKVEFIWRNFIFLSCG